MKYLQSVQKAVKKRSQHVIKGVCFKAYADRSKGSRVWAKALKKCKTRGNHHGIDPLYWVMIRLIDPVQEYHRK